MPIVRMRASARRDTRIRSTCRQPDDGVMEHVSESVIHGTCDPDPPFRQRAGGILQPQSHQRGVRRGTVVADGVGMNTQVMVFGVGGALLLLFAFQFWRSMRDDMNGSAVSDAWLADRKRVKEDSE